MSAIDYTHPMGVARSSSMATIMPVDLTVPSAFCSLASPEDDLRTRASSAGSRLLHCIPQAPTPLVSSSLSTHLRQAAPSSNRLDFYFQNREFLRFPSPPSPSPPSPTHQLPPTATTLHFNLNNSFPPLSYSNRHFHELNHPGAEPESPASSSMSMTPERDLDQAASPEIQLYSKASTESSSVLRTCPERKGLERFPPAKRFIRALPPSPLDESATTGDKAHTGSICAESIKSDKSDDNGIDDETREGEACEVVDSLYSTRSTISTSFSSPYNMSLTSSSPSSPPGPFHSSLFPVSFVPPEVFKSNIESTSPYLKRRHSANNPIVVDSSIPFTTYLHNLTVTLQQSAAARGRSVSSFSDANLKEESKRSRHISENSIPATDSEFKDVSSVVKQETGLLLEDSYAKRRKADRRDHDRRLKNDVNDEEERVHSSDERFINEPKEKKKRRTYLSESSASDLFVHNSKLRIKSGDERHLMTHPMPVPIFSSAAFSMSPDSSVISSTHLHGSHPFSQQCPPPQPLASPQTLQPLAGLSPLRSPRSPREQHPHLSPAIQFPSLYNKLFPPFGPSPSQPSHLNLSASMPGPIQALGGLSSTTNRMSSLFHPGFLNIGNLSMRRTSAADKPPPVKKYKCDVCQKAFSRSNTLVTHKRIHTGDKPFKCEICGRAFRQPGNLTRHRLTHTTHKPYVCHVCNKAFNRASNLNTHIRTHSSLRQFGCSGCPKTFHFKHDMTSHINYSQNGGERLFKCDICGRGFAHSSTLATHRRTHNTTDSQPNSLPTH